LRGHCSRRAPRTGPRYVGLGSRRRRADSPKGRRSLPEARRIVVRVGATVQLRIVRMETRSALDEHLLVFDVVRIGQATLHRADRLTRLVIVEADALGAELRIDDVDLLALADRLVRAFGLASAAVDAVCGDMGRHM